MDLPKINRITSNRETQLETQGRNNIRLVQQDGTGTSYTEILKPPSDGLKNIVNIWIRSCQLLSHAQLQEESVKAMRTSLLLASMVKDQSLDQ